MVQEAGYQRNLRLWIMLGGSIPTFWLKMPYLQIYYSIFLKRKNKERIS